MNTPRRGDADQPGIREMAAIALELNGTARDTAASFSAANPEILKRISRGAPSLLLAENPDLSAGPAGTTPKLGG